MSGGLCSQVDFIVIVTCLSIQVVFNTGLIVDMNHCTILFYSLHSLFTHVHHNDCERYFVLFW